MNIFKNKPKTTPTYQLDLIINPVYTFDNDTWLPANNELIPFDDIRVAVIYDNQVWFDQLLTTDTVRLTKELDDTPGDHQLKILLSGKTNEHSLIITGQEVTFSLYIDLKIEDLPLNFALFETETYVTETGQVLPWTEFMGINGAQTVTIRTPIYSWLFEHEKYILSEFRQKG
jgi:hypothetical protein